MLRIIIIWNVCNSHYDLLNHCKLHHTNWTNSNPYYTAFRLVHILTFRLQLFCISSVSFLIFLVLLFSMEKLFMLCIFIINTRCITARSVRRETKFHFLHHEASKQVNFFTFYLPRVWYIIYVMNVKEIREEVRKDLWWKKTTYQLNTLKLNVL